MGIRRTRNEVSTAERADRIGVADRADKQFEARLEALELRPCKSAAAVAREHGLDIQRLYTLYFFALNWRFDEPQLAAYVAGFPRAAQALNAAARAVRFLETVHAPCFENFEGAQTRIDARFHGAAPSDLRTPLRHPLEALGPIAEWQTEPGSFPMPMEEIRLPGRDGPNAREATSLRLAVLPIWLSPFNLPAGLVRAVEGRTTEHQRSLSVTDWTRCAIAETKDFRVIADLLDRLALQAETIHASMFRRGRRVEHDRKAFRHRFAEYAVACCGKTLDDLGAALFSMIFGEIDAQEYGRLRRRDERERKDAPHAPGHRKQRTK